MGNTFCWSFCRDNTYKPVSNSWMSMVFDLKYRGNSDRLGYEFDILKFRSCHLSLIVKSQLRGWGKFLLLLDLDLRLKCG